MAQITSSSYDCFYGQKHQDISNQMIEIFLVLIQASDVPHIKHHRINLEGTFRILGETHGAETVDYFKKNARDIFNGDPVRARQANKKHKKFLGLF